MNLAGDGARGSATGANLASILKSEISHLARQEQKRIASAPTAAKADDVRFSGGWVAAHRNKLWISVADYGRLVGVSGLTIYSW